jgi:hypothetical protein
VTLPNTIFTFRVFNNFTRAQEEEIAGAAKSGLAEQLILG